MIDSHNHYIGVPLCASSFQDKFLDYEKRKVRSCSSLAPCAAKPPPLGGEGGKCATVDFLLSLLVPKVSKERVESHRARPERGTQARAALAMHVLAQPKPQLMTCKIGTHPCVLGAL